jgi:serine-type D-Ala-D-Ala carboxypeptidase/endopeptidase (penicillin-binding protein 4)
LKRHRRRAASIAAAVAAIVALAGCGGGGGGGGRRGRSAATRDATRVRSALVGAGSARSAALFRSPALRHLQAVAVGALRESGPAVGILVEDLDTGQVLFTRNATVARAPASVEKLYTSVAVLQLLGRNARLHTDILGTGHLGRGGVWQGNLYLRGDGDPTFGDGDFNQTYEDGYGPTAAQLVAQLQHDGIRRVAGYLIADESRFDTDRGGPATGNRADIPDYGGQLSALVYDHGSTAKGYTPATFAANEVALTARSEGIGLFASGRSGRTPAGARVLATVASPPMSVLLKLMDVPSDDLFADLLAKQLGYDFDHHGTLAAGAGVISGVLSTRYGLHPLVFDGSGLDKADRSSPADIVALLRQVWRTPVGSELADALPMVGETGTVQDMGVHTAARGRCAAKTGTLNNVTNLAGYCAAVGGHTLAFALMIDGPANWQAIETLGTLVGAIAAY